MQYRSSTHAERRPLRGGAVRRVAVLALLASLAAGALQPGEAAAQRRFPEIGIHEVEPSYIATPRFRELVLYHPRRPQAGRFIRGIFPWDLADPVAPHRGDDERAWFDEWVTAVRRLGAEPFVVFNHGGVRVRDPRRYRRAFDKFIEIYGPNGSNLAKVDLIAPWNEPNRRVTVSVRRKGKDKQKQVITTGPRTAARFFSEAEGSCRAHGVTCRLVAGEFAGNMSERDQRFYRIYFDEMRRKRAKPYRFGVHIAADVKRFQVCNSSRARTQIRQRTRALRERRHPSSEFPYAAYCRGKGARARLLAEFRERLVGRRGAFRGVPVWVTEVPTYRSLAFARKGFRVNLTFEDTVQCRAVTFLQRLRGVQRVYIYRFADRRGVVKRKVSRTTERGLFPRSERPVPRRERPTSPRPSRMNAFFNVKFLDGKCRGHAYATAFSTGQRRQWIANHGLNAETQLLADVDADSAADAVVYRRSDGAWFVARARPRPAPGSFEPQRQWLSNHRPGAERVLMDDVNDDNRADAVVFDGQAGAWYVALSQPNGTFAPEPGPWRQGFGVGSSHVALSDVNGDGSADAVAYYSDGSWRFARAMGRSFGAEELWISGHGVGSEEQMLDDVNGDDLPDAVVYDEQTGAWDVVASNRAAPSPSPPERWASGFAGEKRMLDDVTGDNVADAIVYNDGTWTVAPSVATEFLVRTRKAWARGFGRGAKSQRVGDVTGDDKGDAVVFDAGNWTVQPAAP